MKLFSLCFCVLFVGLVSRAQTQTMVVFDLVAGTIDTLPPMSFDTTVTEDHTPHGFGNFDNNIAPLPQMPPDSGVFPGTHFRKKQRAADDYNLTDYPVRTSVKLFSIKGDSLLDLCSGSMISKRYVLTAAHCFVDFSVDTLLSDSILAAPVYNNGAFAADFETAYASKIYTFRHRMPGADFAVLELEKPLGEATGWIGIGFNDSDTALAAEVFHKFSYPVVAFPPLPQNRYNGDTLYHSYGSADHYEKDYIGFTQVTGGVGESGSSMIKVENSASYTSYGVLTWSGAFRHSRLTNRRFYALAALIEDDLHLSEPRTAAIPRGEVYPNPTSGKLHIAPPADTSIRGLILYDSAGRKLLMSGYKKTLDLTPLPRGVYYLKIDAEQGSSIHRILKE